MTTPIDLKNIRETLAAQRGQQYWRSLDELAGTQEFNEALHREFPQGAAVWESDAMGRRKFLTLMGASLALAGVTGCSRQPEEKIVAYTKMPEMLVPGMPLMFATAMPLAGYGIGLLAESHMGRPTKVEGNPSHPGSLGASSAFAQASVLTMYDPDRSAAISRLGVISTWDVFVSDINALLPTLKANGGAGIRVLTETVTSPSVGAQLNLLTSRFPGAKWHQYQPVGRDGARNGSMLAFGEYVETKYDFSKANVVLSLDGDFYSEGATSQRYTKDFSARRAPGEDLASSTIARLYSVQSSPNLVGSMADHRLTVKASQVDAFTRALAATLGVGVAGGDITALGANAQKFLETLVADLQANKGTSLVIPGQNQPAAVHALAHAINAALGNVGQTVAYTESVEVKPVDQTASIRELVADMNAGAVELLLILGGNPVYNAPAELKFTEALEKVTSLRVHLSAFPDETSTLCEWHLPELHYLEAWGDVRAYDGTVSLIQPLIAPLYGGRSAHEVLDLLTSDQPGKVNYDLVKAYWQAVRPSATFDKDWEKWLSEGIIDGTQAVAKSPVLKSDWASLPAPAATDGIEIIFQPDPTIFDGSFANNGWLQECPKPLSRMTWDNAIYVNPHTGVELGLKPQEQSIKDASVATITVNGQTIKGPVRFLPGHPRGSITVHLGYGRTKAGRVGDNVGFNAYAIRTSENPWFVGGAEVKATSETQRVACVEDHSMIDLPMAMEQAEKRQLVRVGTLEDYKAHPEHIAHEHFSPAELDKLSQYAPIPEMVNAPYQWGMAIDLSRCTGCTACVIACQSENNIPVVGKEQVYRQREMHWIRIDRYYQGDLDDPKVVHQPVPCMQCEKAPCEVVCPAAATMHSEEGLNDMVYNRCVGTRYCSNNCPYKVRRFNFLKFSDHETESLKPMRNPDVTVRSRGVMEKCTYCVQRINHARQDAKRDGREIMEGEIMTACQQACAAGAITFGNIKDQNSAVSKRKQEMRNYSLLGELGARPRTTYLAKLTNPNPELEPKESHSGGENVHHG